MESNGRSRGADPFETAPESELHGAPSIRESAVIQAVKFLEDPRVQAADHQKAIGFLRKKDLSEAEVREAFKRASLPWPDSLSGTNRAPWVAPAPASNVVMLPPGAHLRVDAPRRGTSWTAVFWGITVAAGTLTVLRELLRRYVAPLYFPEAERRVEERRRREVDQINDLRDSMRELVRSSQETSARVERLSTTLSSTGMLDDGRAPSSSLKHTSGTVATLGGGSSRGVSERSRGVLERLDELREEVNSLKVLSSGAFSSGGGALSSGGGALSSGGGALSSGGGALSCGGRGLSSGGGAPTTVPSSATSLRNVDEFYTPRQTDSSVLAPRISGAEAVADVARQLGDELGGSPSTVRSRRSVSFNDAVEMDEKEAADRLASGAQQESVAPPTGVSPLDDDEFMKMEPAHVEKAWSALGRERKGPGGGGGEEDSAVGNAKEEGTARGGSEDKTGDKVPQPSDLTAVVNEAGVGGDVSDDVTVVGSKAEQGLKFEKFREAMLAEAELVETQGATGDHQVPNFGGGGLDSSEFVGLSAKDRRASTASAPAPETSLSDVE